MCKLLIEAGCDISHQDSSHKTAAFYAKKFGKNEVYEYLTNELQKIKSVESSTVKSKVFYKLVKTDDKGQSI
jgi:ankyrin repeat protein